MQRPIPWLWILLAGLLLLAPGPAGRLLLDLLGGITLTVLLLPVLLGVGGLVAWKVLQSRLKPCPACGFVSAGSAQCPSCGAVLGQEQGPASSNEDVDASSATIDVSSVEVEVMDQSDGN
ncbi:hypothetical protein KBY49_11500 [Cyanobium sp. WAJ14-Wanaka]|nr:hypothetical protein [Cyanobium sp. WAJ14-Wanaka]